jgi:hypothetical protein
MSNNSSYGVTGANHIIPGSSDSSSHDISPTLSIGMGNIGTIAGEICNDGRISGNSVRDSHSAGPLVPISMGKMALGSFSIKCSPSPFHFFCCLSFVYVTAATFRIPTAAAMMKNGKSSVETECLALLVMSTSEQPAIRKHFSHIWQSEGHRSTS